MKTQTLFAALAAPLILGAEEFKLIIGEVVKGNISRVEPDGLILMTDAGIAKVPFLGLPEEVQKRFGYDPAKAQEIRAQQRAAQQQILQGQIAGARARQQQLADREFDESRIESSCRILQILDGGGLARVSATVEVKGVETVTLPPATALDLAPRVIQRPTTSTRNKLVAERAMIWGLPRGLADDDVWTGPIWPAGTYSYGSEDRSRLRNIQRARQGQARGTRVTPTTTRTP